MKAASSTFSLAAKRPESSTSGRMSDYKHEYNDSNNAATYSNNEHGYSNNEHR
jgi:hypothetical protein